MGSTPTSVGFLRSIVFVAGLSFCLNPVPVHAQAAEENLTVLETIQELFLDWWGRSDPVAEPAAPPPLVQDNEVNLFPDLSIISLEPREIRAGEGETAELIVRRTDDSADISVEVTVESLSDSADSDTDFAPVNELVVFEPGVLEQTITLSIVDDGIHEKTESFLVQLRGVRRGKIDAVAQETRITITDNDDLPVEIRPAVFSAIPNSIDFGNAQIGDGRKVVREITFVNNGEIAGQVLGLDLENRVNTTFSILNSDCPGRKIGAANACSAVLLFEPLGAGVFEDKLVLLADTGKLSVVLKGSGTFPAIVEDVEGAILAAQRAARRQVKSEIITHTAAAAPAVEPVKYYNEDADYSELSIGKNFHTYPVERSRIITVDRFIPCVLETSINTQKPGFIQCVVESHVYGSNGRLILIRKGTNVVGSIESLESGDTRANPVWHRFIQPDGSSISITDGFQGLDIAGQTGAPVHLEKRTVEKYGPALLTTLISAGFAAAVPPGNDRFTNAGETIADNMSEITFQLLEDAVNIETVGTIPAGTRLMIKPIVDLWFKTPNQLAPVGQDP